MSIQNLKVLSSISVEQTDQSLSIDGNFPKERVVNFNIAEKFSYNPAFDTLRGFAIFAVLLLHGSYGFFKGGWIGVDLFFVLSGYLISSILLKEYRSTGTVNILRFYVRRFLRLLPALFICILIANILWAFTKLYDGANEKHATFAALFYYVNLIPGNIAGNMAHLWSLSVEEHFYLFFPLLASLFLFKIPKRFSIGFLTVVILLVSIFRIMDYHHHYQLHFNSFIIDPYTFTFCRIDSILIGVIVGLSMPIVEERDKKNSLTSFALAIILMLFLAVILTLSKDNSHWNNGGFVFTNLLCGVTVLFAAKNPFNNLLSNRLFRYVGVRSYGIYVYHFPIFLALEGLRTHHSYVNFILVSILRFGITLLVAEISFKFVESPVLRFKKHFEFSKYKRAE